MPSKERLVSPEPAPGPINPAQMLQLERMRLGSFNSFDGDWVAERLAQKRQLWKSFVFGRFVNDSLIELRDLAEGHINADELYILTEKARLDELMAEIHTEWDADQTSWIRREETAYVGTGWFPFEPHELWQQLGADLKPDEVVVRVWWD